MTALAFDVVGFDLDGTLLDTSADLAGALNHALAAAGRTPLTTGQVKPMVGDGVKRLLERGLAATGGPAPEEIDRLYHVLLDHYEANISAGTRPYPGMTDALDRLDAMGIKLAVCTNKLERLARQLLEETDLGDRFACVIGGDTMGSGNAKPSAAPIQEMIARCGGGRAAFVGDSINDVIAARNAGIPSIVVSFGFPNGPVEALGADCVIDHFDELVPMLDRLGSAPGARERVIA